MIRGFKKFIVKIREEKEAVRKRWLVILSTASMMLIIGLWIVYVNIIVETPESTALSQTKTPEQEKPGIKKTFSAGLDVILNQFGATGGGLTELFKNKFGTTNLITVIKAEQNFVLERLEPVKKISLP